LNASTLAITDTSPTSAVVAADNVSTVTTGSFTPTASTLLVALFVLPNGGGGTPTLTDSVSGTWTKLVSYSNSFSYSSVWIKDAGSSPSAQTVTATVTSSSPKGLRLQIRQMAGAALAANQNGTTVTLPGAAGSGDTLAITPSQTSSLVVGSYTEFVSGITLTANAATTIYSQGIATGGETGAVFVASAASVASTPMTLGFTNTSPGYGVFAMAEILAVASAGLITTSNVADVAVAGVSTLAAPADHKHGREGFGAVTAQTSFGLASANGTAITEARSDHTHGTPAAPAAGMTLGKVYAASINSLGI
jgi:hypothetical protein